MFEMLEKLKETPLPIILVIGGLIFLLIPFIQKVQSKEIGIETTNQFGAGLIGIILLAIGIGLYLVPSQTISSTSSPTEIATAVSQPKSTFTAEQSLPPTSTTSLLPPVLPDGYISIGKYFSGKEDSDGKPGNQVYSHFISGKIKYTRISADDDINKIELVCTDSTSDITGKFFPIPKPQDDIFPNYASETIEILPNCRVDFYVVDTVGLETGISVYSEIVP